MTTGRRLRSALVSRLYRDVGGGVEDASVVAGMARSGTTWLAELISTQGSCRLMFEPFHNARVREYARFAYQQYMRPASVAPELAAFTDRLLRGEIRNRWIDRQSEHLRPRFRLVKAVRGSLLLGWLHARYPQLPIVLLIRHPCANVASFLRLGWSSDEDLRSILGQSDLVDDHLADRLDLVERATRLHQRHAVLWSVANAVPLRQLSSGGMHAFHYEDLVERPDQTIPDLFRALGRSFDDSVYRGLDRPSRTARGGTSFEGASGARVPGWRRDLGASEIDDILEIVSAFGLGDLYDVEGRPTGALARFG